MLPVKRIVIIGGIITSVMIAIFAVSLNANMFEQTRISQDSIQHISNTNSKLKVIASFYPMYEFTRNVAGDRADVSVFIPIGSEPHGWEPPTQQIQDVQNTQLFIYNGAGMEAFIPAFVSTG